MDKIVGNLDIKRSLECVQESFKEDPALASIEKYATHSSIKTLKAECMTLIQISHLNLLNKIKFLKK